MQARARLQWFEVAVRQQNESEAIRRASSIFSRHTLLRLNAASQSLGVAERPEPEFLQLACADRNEEADDARELPDSPSAKTPSGGTKAFREVPVSSLSEGVAPQSPASTPSGSKAKTRRGGEKELVWKKKVTKEDGEDSKPNEAPASPNANTQQAARTPECVASKSSPTKRSPPPALDQLEEDTKASTEPCRADGAAVATPNKRLDMQPAVTPTATPSKRLAIVDPNTGKSIEVTPVADASRTKPTLISLEAISEGRSQLPLSPAGPAAPPLTLPPVVAGAPPLMQTAAPLRYAAPLPSYAGMPPPTGSPNLGPNAVPGAAPPYYPPAVQGYPIGAPSWPPPPPGAAPSGVPPPCPPPSHPAPMVGGSSSSAHAAVAGGRAAVEAVSMPSPVAERLADALFGAGGPVQMARGALAGGRASEPQEATAVGSGKFVGNGPPPPPAGPAPLQPPGAAASLTSPPETPLPHWNAAIPSQAPLHNSTGPALGGTSGLLGLAGYGAPPSHAAGSNTGGGAS